VRRANAGFRRVGTAALAFALAGCGALDRARPPAPAPAPETVSRPAERPGRLVPMPVHPLSVKTECSFSDETGYSGRAVLNVDYAQVLAFSAHMNLPRRGRCSFELAEFRQTRREPHVELVARDGCTVRMWEQGEQVTVAFSRCARKCTGNSFEYLWPLLVDRPSGRCD
jgi:hypothetical protein